MGGEVSRSGNILTRRTAIYGVFANSASPADDCSLGGYGDGEKFVSAKNLLRSAYQELRMYRLVTQLFEMIVRITHTSAPVFAKDRNLEDVRSIV